MKVDLRNGDCVEVMKTLADASVDAVVTDPPYELGFMGKGWDASGIAYREDLWREVLRVLKPGGHLLAFGGTRTYHRMACAIEDAGFEIRDSIHWIYGSGFPKSLDVSKAIDATVRLGGSNTRKLRQTEQETGGESYEMKGRNNGIMGEDKVWERKEWAPTTDAAKQWNGWGTALKPAHEPVIVARKPLVGTVAVNVQAHGTGALNIDGCRVQVLPDDDIYAKNPNTKGGFGHASATIYGSSNGAPDYDPSKGRWPPNFLLSHTPECGEACAEDCAVAEMDRQSGFSRSPPVGSVAVKVSRIGQAAKGDEAARVSPNGHGDSGGASRFFPVFRYQAKASRSERGIDNKHPTVKPVALMRWLVRLVTPPGGVVLEPFMGSGTTGVACVQESFDFIGIEREAEYFEICKARIAAAQAESPTQKELF